MPILQMGESSGPIANGMTYIVRPAMQPLKRSCIVCLHLGGIGPVVRRPGIVRVSRSK